MTQVKLTKNELRNQQEKLHQLQRYLPTLQLKKAMLQTEVGHAIFELRNALETLKELEKGLEPAKKLMEKEGKKQIEEATEIAEVTRGRESIAGVEIPIFGEITFHTSTYSVFDTPIWYDDVKKGLRNYKTQEEKVAVATARKEALEDELREVSIRVNLFEKIIIPRTQSNIKKIKVFLGDQQLAAVAQAKIAKGKISAKRGVA